MLDELGSGHDDAARGTGAGVRGMMGRQPGTQFLDGCERDDGELLSTVGEVACTALYLGPAANARSIKDTDMTPRINDSRGDRPVPPLILVGLGAQIVGVAAQAAFHLSDGNLPSLTEAGTSVMDHVISNVGVVCLAWQAGRWLRGRSAWSTLSRRLMMIGTGVEVAGAMPDGIGHVVGGEFRAAFAAIGVGFLLVSGGAMISTRSAH
ncbi:hypothetical protein NQ036_00085 [Brevibacterium sp. 91QC2O2]|uniref:hypothetical protein n=1 Tax=Brevibacterium TaxID=1696 RepID=UPI00211B9925|nr:MULTISPECIES: hypothetical protein [unclassified Brevibacterium]MCQ9366649.1 hypothetical protein [Brevibacterium sp. 91QC2O2]MCQ9384469.1 hypothetical protein [Brevibacterium sp. 68QC2CO]